MLSDGIHSGPSSGPILAPALGTPRVLLPTTAALSATPLKAFRELEKDDCIPLLPVGGCTCDPTARCAPPPPLTHFSYTYTVHTYTIHTYTHAMHGDTPYTQSTSQPPPLRYGTFWQPVFEVASADIHIGSGGGTDGGGGGGSSGDGGGGGCGCGWGGI